MKYIVVGSRYGASKYDASIYNLDVNVYTYEAVVEWLDTINKEDALQPDINYVIDKVNSGQNVWFSTKYFMFCIKVDK